MDYWGKPFWRRVIPQTPFLNLLMIFLHQGIYPLMQKNVRGFKKRGLEKNAPKRDSSIIRQKYITYSYIF